MAKTLNAGMAEDRQAAREAERERRREEAELRREQSIERRWSAERETAAANRAEDIARADRIRTEDIGRADRIRSEDVSRAQSNRTEDIARAERFRSEDKSLNQIEKELGREYQESSAGVATINNMFDTSLKGVQAEMNALTRVLDSGDTVDLLGAAKTKDPAKAKQLVEARLTYLQKAQADLMDQRKTRLREFTERQRKQMVAVASKYSEDVVNASSYKGLVGSLDQIAAWDAYAPEMPETKDYSGLPYPKIGGNPNIPVITSGPADPAPTPPQSPGVAADPSVGYSPGFFGGLMSALHGDVRPVPLNTPYDTLSPAKKIATTTGRSIGYFPGKLYDGAETTVGLAADAISPAWDYLNASPRK